LGQRVVVADGIVVNHKNVLEPFHVPILGFDATLFFMSGLQDAIVTCPHTMYHSLV
jgi:hypothetical protein